MTIAAGFSYEGGVLLCADTLYTGAMKVHQSKIVPFEHNGGFAAFALAGHEGYAKLAIQACQRSVRKSQRATSEDVRQAAEDALVSVYSKHIDARPVHEQYESQIALLVASWGENDGLHLYASRKTAVIETQTFECIGSGEYLAHYIVSPVYESGPSAQLMRGDWKLGKRDAIVLAIKAMAAVKTHDPSCGGRSEMLAISSDGSRTPIGYHHLDREIQQAESIVAEFNEAFNQLLFSIADPSISDENLIRQAQDYAANVVKGLRYRWKLSSKWGLSALIGESFPEDPDGPLE